MPTNAELRAMARGSLSGNWTSAVLHMLLYCVIQGVIQYFIEEMPFVGWVGNLLVSGALTFGLVSFYLLISRGEKPETSVLFSGFNRFVNTFLLSLLMSIFTILWTLLLIVPGIIAALRYSQAYYILRDNPEIGAMEAIRRSKALMDGQKGKLFMLTLSFIGWFLLTILTLGIGILWLAPYVYTAFGHFHNSLISRSATLPPPPNPYSGVTV
ncbi:DUF975 family protein [Cohnella luojiensis]|uniref:DUF975 family protein n=1 Tax=Cohnella luojiensis TaxID=652876 RepID=A0A4Y8LRR9_9BACL|nr:DUF975 family protein [Cohnella luojiensis]TFE23999.1 DUF975 family protein [Cohnella luojiensis]